MVTAGRSTVDMNATPSMFPCMLRYSALILGAALFASACGGLTAVDTSGTLYAHLRGTVTRASGGAVGRVEIGVSCTGKEADPFGFSGDTDVNGRFEMDLNAPSVFEPLEGMLFVCRVLTPVSGTPQAEKAVSVQFSSSRASKPTTEMSLVVP